MDHTRRGIACVHFTKLPLALVTQIPSHRVLILATMRLKLPYGPHPAKHYMHGLYKFTDGPRDTNPLPSNFNPCHHEIKTPLCTTPGEAIHAWTLQIYCVLVTQIPSRWILIPATMRLKLPYEPHPAKHYMHGLYKFTDSPRDADLLPLNFDPCHHAIETPLWTTPGEAFMNLTQT